MKTVHEVSALTGVSIRTLQYYDRIGLLTPASRTDAGYRLYGEAELLRLQEILLFRELDFSLPEIRQILSSPAYERSDALRRQIALLQAKKERLERLIELAGAVYENGGHYMDFHAFDNSSAEALAEEAKRRWGSTPEYAAFAEKTGADASETADAFMELFAQFGAMRGTAPDDPEVQAQVRRLQDFISAHYYPCSDETLRGLGAMYTADERFRRNIDRAGGEGTAEFVSAAIARI